MDPETEPTAPAPPEDESADSALAPADDTSAGDAQATADPAPDAPAAASAPDAETPPEQPFDKRKFLEDPEIANWMEERVNARVNKHLQQLQQRQADAQQQAQLDDLIQRADAGDYEAERALAALKVGEYRQQRTLTDPILTTRVLDGMVRNYLASAKLPPDVQQAAYTATTVEGFVDTLISHRLKDYVPKTEAARREAQAAEKERLRLAKTSAVPDLAPSAGFVEAPSSADAEITAITERTRRRGYLTGEDAKVLERYQGAAV
jgi:hypothetical protein